MGLIMLVLIGLLPASFALNLKHNDGASLAQSAAKRLKISLASYQVSPSAEVLHELDSIINTLEGKASLREIPLNERWSVRSEIFQLDRLLEKQKPVWSRPTGDDLMQSRSELRQAIEYVPIWVVVSVALSLGIGTTIGYKRIVVTVAEKIGKTHLTYAQGACAEFVAMTTIGLADLGGLPVSTTQVLSSGIAGTMCANRSGIQSTTIRNIGFAWVLTFPAAMLMAAGLFLFGHFALGH
jgi:phosphate/sulfate permease